MNITIDNWLEFRKGKIRENKHLEFRKSQILEEALDAFANNWKIAMGCQVHLSSADWDTQYCLFTGGECVDSGVNYEL